MDRIHKVTD